MGAQVRIKATINGESVWQMREISASNGFRSISNDFWAHFGLGAAKRIDLIEVSWPSGKKSTLTNVTPDQFLTITE
ncbi:ASPIC/UnbV domain-containing protein [Bacteroidota bacterium]